MLCQQKIVGLKLLYRKDTNKIMLKPEEYDREKYKMDFPNVGTFKWSAVQIIMPDDIYYDGCKLTGVLLHDGNFMCNGQLFLVHEFKVLEKETEEIKKLMGMSLMKGQIRNAKLCQTNS